MHRYKKFLVVCLSVVIVILIIFIQNREATVHDSFSETGTNQYIIVLKNSWKTLSEDTPSGH